MGTISVSSSNRFGFKSLVRMARPVRLPPGRAMLATSPAATGSVPVSNTTGIDDVASFATRAASNPPAAVITSTLRATRSAASSGNRSARPFRPAIFERDVPTLDIAGFAQPFVERRQERSEWRRCGKRQDRQPAWASAARGRSRGTEPPCRRQAREGRAASFDHLVGLGEHLRRLGNPIASHSAASRVSGRAGRPIRAGQSAPSR